METLPQLTQQLAVTLMPQTDMSVLCHLHPEQLTRMVLLSPAITNISRTSVSVIACFVSPVQIQLTDQWSVLFVCAVSVVNAYVLVGSAGQVHTINHRCSVVVQTVCSTDWEHHYQPPMLCRCANSLLYRLGTSFTCCRRHCITLS